MFNFGLMFNFFLKTDLPFGKNINIKIKKMKHGRRCCNTVAISLAFLNKTNETWEDM